MWVSLFLVIPVLIGTLDLFVAQYMEINILFNIPVWEGVQVNPKSLRIGRNGEAWAGREVEVNRRRLCSVLTVVVSLKPIRPRVYGSVRSVGLLGLYYVLGKEVIDEYSYFI